MLFVYRASRCLPRLAVVAFALRALVPLGYMPDVTGAFGRITLCHGDPAFEIVARYDAATAMAQAHHDSHDQAHAAAGHQHHSEHQDSGPNSAQAGSHDAWEHCQFGSTLAGAALFVEHVFEPLSIDTSTPTSETTIAVGRLSLRPYSARAPPSV
jgi:hypothetical protein